MEDWEEEDWEQDRKEEREQYAEEQERMDRGFAERGIPYIVDLYRKKSVLQTTYAYLASNNRNGGQLYELGRQLREYMSKKSTESYFESIEGALRGVEIDWYVRGDRNIAINKLYKFGFRSDVLFELHDFAKNMNRDLRTMSDYWALCGYTLPQSSNGLHKLMAEIHC